MWEDLIQKFVNSIMNVRAEGDTWESQGLLRVGDVWQCLDGGCESRVKEPGMCQECVRGVSGMQRILVLDMQRIQRIFVSSSIQIGGDSNRISGIEKGAKT